jgi:hypothetical protein
MSRLRICAKYNHQDTNINKKPRDSITGLFFLKQHAEIPNFALKTLFVLSGLEQPAGFWYSGFVTTHD